MNTKMLDRRLAVLEERNGVQTEIDIPNMPPAEREKLHLEIFSRRQGLDHTATKEEYNSWLLATYHDAAYAEKMPPGPPNTASVGEKIVTLEAQEAWRIVHAG